MYEDDEDIEASAGSRKKEASSGEITLFAWVSIITACCIVAIITLQVIEMLHYSAPPSVWPADPNAPPPPKTAPAVESLIDETISTEDAESSEEDITEDDAPVDETPAEDVAADDDPAEEEETDDPQADEDTL